MKQNILLLLSCFTLLVACGPSQDEIKQREIILNDSINKVKQEKDTLVVKEKIKEDSLVKVESSDQLKLKHKLVKLSALYDEECNKLEKVKHHKLLRSKHKKEQQIEMQTKVVAQLKQQIITLKSQIKE